MHEAETLSFVTSSYLDIPVLKVFSSGTHEGMPVMEMEMRSGDTLEEIWPRLSHEEKIGYENNYADWRICYVSLTEAISAPSSVVERSTAVAM